MKKLLLLSLILAFTAGLNAQSIDKKWGFGLGLGGYGAINNNKSEIGLMPELFLSRYLSPRLDLTLKGEVGLWRSDLVNTLDLVNPFLNLRFKLGNESSNLRPYLYAGPGFLLDNGGTGLNFDAGLGAKYYLSSSTALYLDAGYMNGIEVTRISGVVHDNFVKATLGLVFDFGKAKDTDMDGVSDNKDKCPNTPAGVAVDVNGCPVDTDGDGVADYLDACPTVAGLSSLKGCPDTDKDGIADKDDACPTVAGLASLKGCPDTDGDGVADKDDKCPGTKKGTKVDASGCPLDTDKDGIIDEEDNCPTVAGTKENKGCPPVEKIVDEAVLPSMQIEPVYFDYDRSTVNSSEKAKINKLVNLLKGNDALKVNLSGFADSKGTEEYNMKLSERRIDAVVKSITSGGVKGTRVSKENPMGEANPAATNDTEEGRALNRRVEFELIKQK